MRKRRRKRSLVINEGKLNQFSLRKLKVICSTGISLKRGTDIRLDHNKPVEDPDVLELTVGFRRDKKREHVILEHLFDAKVHLKGCVFALDVLCGGFWSLALAIESILNHDGQLELSLESSPDNMFKSGSISLTFTFGHFVTTAEVEQKLLKPFLKLTS